MHHNPCFKISNETERQKNERQLDMNLIEISQAHTKGDYSLLINRLSFAIVHANFILDAIADEKQSNE